MRPLKDIRVLEASHLLTLDVYRRTQGFPPEERYALTSQLRRAAYSVPFHIAEGTARGVAECRQFLRISLGSASELEYGILLSRDLGYLSNSVYEELDNQITPVKKMLVAFIRRLDAQVEAKRPNSQQPIANSPRRLTANGQPPEAP
jgi:four helix bundle protein